MLCDIIVDDFLMSETQQHIIISNEVHRKTDTLFPGNNTTAAELEPLNHSINFSYI